MKPALFLIDIQNDFLDRARLYPKPSQLVPRVGALLAGFRRGRLPIFHIQTFASEDGSDRMPHWAARDYWGCIEGTYGAQPPDALAPNGHETIVRKRFYSGFESGELLHALREKKVDTVVIAGVYTHGCIRATALDAYAHGFSVWIAEDCVASTEQMHAVISRQWLNERLMRFRASPVILKNLGLAKEPVRGQCKTLPPAAYFDGRWHGSGDLPRWQHVNPSKSDELLSEVCCADAELVDLAAAAAGRAQAEWARLSADRRSQLLSDWAGIVDARQDSLARLLVSEIGKPLGDAREEVGRTAAHIRAAVRLLESAGKSETASEKDFSVYHRPVGIVGIITPWNNPLAIPAGKIAPALAFGNAVLWKPALETFRATSALLESVREAGFPPDLAGLLLGDEGTAKALVAHPAVGAVSFTGSDPAGEQVAALCALYRKPLQAELGGNNGAIVLRDADLGFAAKAIAAAAFGFAGQRCTAMRRIIVEEAVRDAFLEHLIPMVRNLNVGDPADPSTQIGPMISGFRRDRLEAEIRQALGADHGHLLCGGEVPASLPGGHWYLPTLLEGVGPDHPIVQEETFGPLAVVQTAKDFEHALALCNGVKQGLVAAIYTRDGDLQRRFMQAAQAGILRVNPQTFPVHPDAPFLGWKSSGIGPAEHGRWDLEFYTRPQVVYGAALPLQHHGGDAASSR